MQERPIDLDEARQLFQELAAIWRNASPPVTAIELAADIGLKDSSIILRLENGVEGHYSQTIAITYAKRIIGLAKPITGPLPEDQARKVAISEKNRLAQAKWRQDHPDLEKERQTQKRKNKKDKKNKKAK